MRIGLEVIRDTEAEDRETILINVRDENGASLTSINLLLLDELEVMIMPENVEVCQGERVHLTTVLPGIYTWFVGMDTIIGDSISIIADEEMNVRVTTSLGTCTAEDDIDITLLTGIAFNVGDTAFICLGEDAVITVDILGNPAGDYVWTPMDTALTVLADQSIQVQTSETRTYFLTFQNDVCTVTDSVVVRVDSIPELPITIIPEKEEYCPGETVTLFSRYLNPADFPDIEFNWTFEAGSPLSGDSLLNFTFSTVDTSYYVRVSTNNACGAKR